ncbi:MAG: ABC transporter permease [Anaerolineae bacterium]|jgi:ABC-2 type transport system permease protein|nr:ABC transporter permease [Anaerolineae bacterium]MBT7190278.1 ABC transporter permease [Anaerolineae bacterium]MBT7990218.1 ABC transporter permease [Anaerolineae bacterium]
MLKRILALTKKEFIHLRNDWWLPAFMLFGGVLELMAVGWATARPISNLPLMVLDHDRSAASRSLVISLENTETFALEAMVEDFQTIEDALDRGEISAAIIIPPNFAEEIAASNGKPSLSMILNGAESVPATAALRAAEGVIASLNEKIIIQRLGLSSDEFDGFAPRLRVWFNEALSEALYTTPAEMGLMLEFTTLLFAALAFSREKELGTLEQLLVMPFSSLEIIIGKAIPVIIVAFTDFVLMLSMVHFVFKVPIRGSLSLLFILAFGYLLVELGKGMVLSVIAKTQMQAFLLVLLFGMSDFMFTGYAAPVESMPKAMQFIANIVPAHHWLEILRGILLKGAGMDVLWPHVAALGILGTIIMTFSLRFVRKALD